MVRIVLILVAFTLFIVVSPRNAADTAPALKLFALPRPALRAFDSPVKATPAKVSPPATAVELSTSREISVDLAMQRYQALSGEPLLKLPPPREDPSGLYGVVKSTILDPITHPEVVKVGKVYLAGGVVGALKEKNPLYLLNPLVFAIDW